MLQLILSTSLAQGVYQLADLKHQMVELHVEEDILQGQIYSVGSLKTIDKKARDMGMIPSTKTNFLDLADDSKSVIIYKK